MKKLQLLLLVALAFANANGQKLPKVQTLSLRAPANVKIDGKPTEWKMQAFNPAVELSYTMANDDKKLYLVVQAKSVKTMRMAILGGVSLFIQKSGEKNHKGAALVQFPYYKEKAREVSINLSPISPDGVPLKTNIDTLVNKANKNLRGVAKLIYTKNLTGVDEVLSLYNEAGIEVMNAFDNTKTYTCELAIDLSLLGLSAANGTKFSYNIMVNGGTNRFEPGFTAARYSGRNSDGTPFNDAQIEQMKQNMQSSNAAAAAATDFWGEYTLTK